MAERRKAEKVQEEVPTYFSKLGSESPKPRQKYGGMFCNVEGAFENKTINFEALSVGKKNGSRKMDGGSPGPGSNGLSESSSQSSSLGSVDGMGAAEKVDLQGPLSVPAEEPARHSQVMAASHPSVLGASCHVLAGAHHW